MFTLIWANICLLATRERYVPMGTAFREHRHGRGWPIRWRAVFSQLWEDHLTLEEPWTVWVLEISSNQSQPWVLEQLLSLYPSFINAWVFCFCFLFVCHLFVLTQYKCGIKTPGPIQLHILLAYSLSYHSKQDLGKDRQRQVTLAVMSIPQREK